MANLLVPVFERIEESRSHETAVKNEGRVAISGISRATEPSTAKGHVERARNESARRKLETTVASDGQNGRQRTEPLSGPAGKIAL